MAEQLTTGVKLGEGIWGSAKEYAVYVNNGTRYQSANPFLDTSAIVVIQKMAGTYKANSLKEIKSVVARAKTLSFINKDVEYSGAVVADMIPALTIANQETLVTLLAAGTAQAKRLCPVAKVNGGTLRRSIMWKTYDKQGGFGAQ